MFLRASHFVSKLTFVEKLTNTIRMRCCSEIRDEVNKRRSCEQMGYSNEYIKKYNKKLHYLIDKLIKIAFNYKSGNKDIPQGKVFNYLINSVLRRRAYDYLSFETVYELEESMRNPGENLFLKCPWNRDK